MTDTQPLGIVKFFVPQDWFDLLSDGRDTAATRLRCVEIVQRTYPTLAQARRDQFVDALMAWRGALMASGTLLYGVVSAPHPEEPETAVHWQVLAGVVDIPSVSTEVDLGALLAQAYGAQFDGPSYEESFVTDMGIGFGFISQSTIEIDDDGDEEIGAPIGLAGALSCRPGADKGLLVLGISLSPEHVWELAGVISVIAGRSTIEEGAEAAIGHQA